MPSLLMGLLVFVLLVFSNNSRGVNAESTWDLLHEGRIEHATTVIGFISDSHGITVGFAGESHVTNDGGKTWPETIGLGLCRFGLDIVDEQVAWNSGNGTGLSVSTDGGASWKSGGNYGGLEPFHCRYLSFLDAKTGWAANATKLGSTSDQGQTWQDVNLPVGIKNLKAIDLCTPQTGHLLDENGDFYSTGDGGKTWSKQALGIKPENFYLTITYTPTAVMRFTDPVHGLIIIRQVKPVQTWLEFVTNDGGKTWQQQSSTVPGKLGTVFLTRNGKYFSILDGLGNMQVFKRR